MMGIKCILFLALFMVWHGVAHVHALPASLTSNSVCKIDEDCPDGQFCYRYQQCASCRNCAKMGRVGPRDGNCARSKDECGPCISGYRDQGNFCIVTTTENTPPLKTEDKSKTSITEGQTADPAWTVFIIVSIVVVVGLISFVSFAVHRRKKGQLRRRNKRESEKIGLTSNSAYFDGQPEGFGASAPVEEYLHQPAYNYNVSVENRPLPPSNAFKKSESRKQQALPFNQGNGSGNWVVHPAAAQFGNHQNFGNPNENALDDPEPFPEQPNDGQVNEDVQDGAVVPPVEEPVVMEEGNIPIYPDPYQNIPGNVDEEMQQPTEEGVLFQFRFHIRAFFGRFANEPRQQQNANPSEGWIDATQMNPMNPIATSNTSLDSGISSSAGEAAVVPSLETSYVEAVQTMENNEVSMMEEHENV